MVAFNLEDAINLNFDIFIDRLLTEKDICLSKTVSFLLFYKKDKRVFDLININFNGSWFNLKNHIIIETVYDIQYQI